MLVVVMFFLIPINPRQLETSPMLLDWKTTQANVSWSVLLLLAGGFAMAKGCEDSGLSAMIGDQLMVMRNWSHIVIMAVMCFVALVLTELISNTATCSVMLPVITQMVSQFIKPRHNIYCFFKTVDFNRNESLTDNHTSNGMLHIRHDVLFCLRTKRHCL